MRFLILLLALVAGTIEAQGLSLPESTWEKDWTREDTKWQLAYTILLTLDCAQTRWAARQPDTENFKEVGIIARRFIGTYPSVGKVNNFCLATGLGHWGISYILPTSTNSREIGFRRAWQGGATLIEVIVVLQNFDNGSKLNFGFNFSF